MEINLSEFRFFGNDQIEKDPNWESYDQNSKYDRKCVLVPQCEIIFTPIIERKKMNENRDTNLKVPFENESQWS